MVPDRRSQVDRRKNKLNTFLAGKVRISGRRSGKDRRKFERFRLKEPTFSELKGNTTVIGEIVDVSMGGLSSRYVGNETLTEGIFKLTVYNTEKGFILRNIPVEIVADQVLPPEELLSATIISRCGVRFIELPKAQESELENFMQNHTL